MKSPNRMRKLRLERGATAVEFALILPIFLVLIVGIIEFGFFLLDKAVLTNACREAARAAITYRPSTHRMSKTDIQKIVLDYCENYMVTFAGTKPRIDPQIMVLPTLAAPPVEYRPDTFSADQYLNITVTYDYTFLIFPRVLSLIGGAGIPTSKTIVATAQMRAE